MRGLLGRVALLWALGLLLLPLPARAAPSMAAQHLRVELLTDSAEIAPGQAIGAAVRFMLEPGWHVYWQNPGDSGEAPRVAFTLPPGLTAGPLRFPVPHRIKTGPLVNYGYTGEAVLLTELAADLTLAPGEATLVADVHWLVCAEECIPGQARLDRKLGVRSGPPAPDPRVAVLFAAARAALPRPLPPEMRLVAKLDSQAFTLTFQGNELRGPGASLFPSEPGLVDNSAAQALTTTPAGFTLRLPRSELLLPEKLVQKLPGVLVFEAPSPAEPAFAYSVEIPVELPAAPPAAPPKPEASLLVALVLALLGGVLLNGMPCVFPVLSLKALSLVKLRGEERRQATLHALLYSAGILVSFWVLAGALIALRLFGQQLGWGFQLQSPRFVVALSALLFLLGLNLCGVFELGLGLTSVGQSVSQKRGLVGAFGTGVLAVVLATPCTAPFMGTALGFALGQPPISALLVFTALGLGLALPYLLLVAVPGLRRLLPRSGPWMETFKTVMGFLLFGTVVWLAWVVGVQAGVEGMTGLLAGLLVVGFSAWVLRSAETRVGGAVGLLLFAVGAIGPGYLVQTRGPGQSATASASAAEGDLPWLPFSPALVEQYRRAGTPVFVDFTAAWCVSCKVNERLVLRSQAVRARFKELGVVALKGDWTHADPVITEALRSFGRSGVPCYVLYGRDPAAPPVTLPEVLTPGIVLSALDGITPRPAPKKP